MPVHDWARVDAGTFHGFHTAWLTHLSEALNGGRLGSGFLEPVYQRAMEVELADRKLPARPQPEIVVLYKGQPLPDVTYRPDFICFGDIVVELKALAAITGVERAQLLNYLKATGFRRGLLLNFGGESLQFERMVYG
ncbi:MAG TPA: GxxExxY protein [Pirellulales bacterium]|nr:GxxExxY protein [Pirellulales bacterium]